MSKYDPWDTFFAKLDDGEHRFSLDDFAELTGVELPRSAYEHAAWWAKAQYHAKWSDHGWYARPQLANREVVFTREVPRRGRPPGMSSATRQPPTLVASDRMSQADLILIGCVSQKRGTSAPARDLYVSPLWRKRRAYAEGTEKPWMILSAEHGLVDPDEILEPYDRYMESQSRDYRDTWSRTVVEDVGAVARRIGARTIELHAGSAYLDFGLVSGLETSGFTVIRPLQGMRIGEQLAWYGGSEPAPIRRAEGRGGLQRRQPEREISADHVMHIGNDYASGALGESWGELPETGAFRLPDVTPKGSRLWLTFICAVDRARDAEKLWSAGLGAWRDDAWVFVPEEVATRPFGTLADTLRRHRLSQRHAQDASAWRLIGESLSSGDCPIPIRSVIEGHAVDAGELLGALDAELPGGTKRFPLLSGPKIGPMWVRMMAYPGGAPVDGIDVIPVAVDTHVQRVTEMLGLVAPHDLDDRHRREIQEVWFSGVALAGSFGGPEPIDGTAAALDPALWVLGKNGCSRCEREGRKVEIGSICDLCPLGRLAGDTTAGTPSPYVRSG